MGKYLLVGIILFSLFLLSKPAIACVGARPISMGGAFIAVADDANVTYWNPAGLGLLTQTEVSYTHTIAPKHTYNYLDYASFVVPLEGSGTSIGALGLSYINTTSFWQVGYFNKQLDKYTISYGRRALGGLSVGANLHYISYYYEKWEDRQIIGYDDESLNLDLALLYVVNDQISLGVLGQDLIQRVPDEEEIKYGPNLRLGIKYSPNEKTIIAFDTYGIKGIRLGAEQIVHSWSSNSQLALRAGIDKRFTGEDEDINLTAGIGFTGMNQGSITRLSLDYTINYWPLWSPNNCVVHLVGISLK